MMTAFFKRLLLWGLLLSSLSAYGVIETFEFESMYPPMFEQAEKEEHKAKRMFKWAVEAEEVHAKLYAAALKAVQEGKDLEETNFYLCPLCGHIEFGKPTENCPICSLPAEKYIEV